MADLQPHFGFFYVHFEGNTKNICKYFGVDNLFIGNRLIDTREQDNSLILWLLITFSSSIGLIIVSLQSENQTKGVKMYKRTLKRRPTAKETAAMLTFFGTPKDIRGKAQQAPKIGSQTGLSL